MKRYRYPYKARRWVCSQVLGLAGASALSLLGFAPSLQAQSKAPVLEEVLVTAQKRTESLQDVPVAVTAISGDDLANTGFRDVGDIVALVPSMSMVSSDQPHATTFRVRRIGNDNAIPTFEPAVALYIDGAYRSRSVLGLGDLVEVRSVEVLKGPQSTLYGKNAGAGVISVSTQGPSDELESMAELSAGSEGYQAAKASLNLPLGERLSTRFGFSGTRRDPLIDNLVGPDADDLGGYALRGQLRYDISDSLSARLVLGRVKRNLNPPLGDTFNSPAHIAIVEDAGGRITNNDPADRVVEQDDNYGFKQTGDDAVLTLEYQGSGYTLTSITAYENYDIDNHLDGVEQIPIDIGLFNDIQAGDSIAQELRLASDSGNTFSWLLGAFYHDNNFTRGDKNRPEFRANEFIEEYGTAVAAALAGASGLLPPGSEVAPILGVEGDRGDFFTEQDSQSFGLFAQAGQRLGEALEATVGLRYSWDEKQGSIVQSNQTSDGTCGPADANLMCDLTPNGSDYADTDQWSAVTGDINLSYFTPGGNMLYAKYSRGFKAGGYVLEWGDFTDDQRKFDEEKVASAELGWKLEFWDRRARINGSVFRTDYENFQNASFVGLVFLVNNAEKVISQGIEVDSTWLLTEKFTANLNLAWIDAYYDKYTGGRCHYGRTPDNALGQCDLSGQDLPFTGKINGNIALTWNQPLLTGDLYARLDSSYTDETNQSPDLDPRHEQDAYVLSNFRLGWRNARFDVSGWVRNLSDESYSTFRGPANVGASVDEAVGSPVGSFQNYLGQPRTYGATLRLTL